MVSRFFLAVALTLAVGSGAMAAGSPSPSRPQPSNYEVAVKAVQAGDYARALWLLQRVVKAEPRWASST